MIPILDMTHRLVLKLCIYTTLSLLASCSTMQDKITSEPPGWTLEQHQRQQIQTWEIRGRLGIQTADNGGTMDMIWKQSLQSFSIRLIAPLGSGTYLVKGGNDSAEILFPDGRKKVIHDINNIFQTALDVDLPVHAIKDWVRGLPASALPVDEISWNDQGLLLTIKQSGWNVEMKKYSGKGVLLPHTIYLSRDDNDDLDIRLALRQWKVDN